MAFGVCLLLREVQWLKLATSLYADSVETSRGFA